MNKLLFKLAGTKPKKSLQCVVILVCFSFFTLQSYGQGVSISSGNTPPDPSAMLDVSSTTQGALIPRMTTAQRNAIVNPAEGLQVFNITTKCLEIYISPMWQSIYCGCNGPTNVSASASPSTLCTGSSISLSGSAGGATSWSWTGPNGYTSSQQNPVIASATTVNSGVYTLTATNQCGTSAPATTISVSVTALPTVAAAGPDINPACGATTATLAANTPINGTGVWSVISGNATVTTPGSPTSGVTGLTPPGTATLRWTISNSPCIASFDDMTITTTTCWAGCGNALTVNHTAGLVAPENRSVNYGTVTTSLTGSSKCWITQNLGSTNQATSATDASDGAAGWYWQFNRKQGYKVGPSPSWTTSTISETSDWLAANDPCTIELGAGWRIPTNTEWTNAKTNGSWAGYTAAYASVLKLHTAGYLDAAAGALSTRGQYGTYASSTSASLIYDYTLFLYSATNSWIDNGMNKAYGSALRCLKD